jgi:malonate transporter and related proteins
LVALGPGLRRFKIAGEMLGFAIMRIMKLAVMPLFAWTLASPLLHLPPLVGDVIVLFTAMPAGANAYLFASQHRSLEKFEIRGCRAGHASIGRYAASDDCAPAHTSH